MLTVQGVRNEEHESIALRLLRLGSCVNATDKCGRSAVYYGCRVAKEDFLDELWTMVLVSIFQS